MSECHDPLGDPQLWSALGSVRDPCMWRAGRDLSILDMGIVRRVEAKGPSVTVELVFTDPTCGQEDHIMASIEAALCALPGVESVSFEIGCLPVWTNERLSPRARRVFAEDRQRRRESSADLPATSAPR